MAFKTASKNGFSVRAYQGDAKTLLAFNFANKSSATNLAGFTIQAEPKSKPVFYILNELRFETPGAHAQVATEPASSSVNAPIHKFRWLHVPGLFHQGIDPLMGSYTYTVTPRYFDDKQSMLAIDPKLSVSVTIDVVPFQKGSLALGFTRGFTQSQAFVHHFGLKAAIVPNGQPLQFNTGQVAGTNPEGQKFTFLDEYEWSGYTARKRIFDLLNEVKSDKSLHLDVFAYDLNEPDIIGILLQLAKEGRIRIILDNASLHHGSSNSKKPAKNGKAAKKPKGPPAEDQFEALFNKAAKKPAAILRGKFARYSHDKIFIVSKNGKASTVLTGSTNFSLTGMNVNSNHVLVFDDATVASKYLEVFEAAWQGGVKKPAFVQSPLSQQTLSFSSKTVPQTEITYSPHSNDFALKVLTGLANRVKAEGKKGKSKGSVLFAVMEIGTGSGPVYPTLQKLHEDQSIFSYGITDTTDGIELYRPGTTQGVLVTGKPVATHLPPPFDQVRSIPGIGHQVHHKFVVCGFNGDDPVVYCGSSNLAEGGEESNGDNLLAIHDGDVATAFAIEALALVDHFDFLDRSSTGPKGNKKPPKFASKLQAAVSAGWFLSTTDKWTKPYFDPHDLHCVDRELFGA
jgi:phosphatidylserine/phosphatidylglycerophosphate/cardiolipin synthase-like enzyme